MQLSVPSGVVRWADLRQVPWKNGGGITRELAGAARCRPSGPDAFAWRISLADVRDDGAFSAFPGVDRIVTVVDGAGMALTVDGEVRLARPSEPLRFTGDSDTLCQLVSGPVTNLNVMTLRGSASAAVEVVDVGSGDELSVEDGETSMVLAVTGELAVRVVGSEQAASLGRLDSWWQGGSARLRLAGGGTALVARVRAG